MTTGIATMTLLWLRSTISLQNLNVVRSIYSLYAEESHHRVQMIIEKSRHA